MDSLIDLFLSRKFPEETRSTLPSNKRIFLDTVLNGNSAPITERDLSPDELKFLANTWKERSEGMLKTIKPYEDALRQRIAKDDIEKNPDRKLRREAREAYERDLRSFDLARQGTYNQDWQNFNKGKLNYWNQMLLKDIGIPPHHEFQGRIARNNMRYEDYPQLSRTTQTGATPEESLQTLLGRFTYQMNRNGKPVVVDTYDFNPPTSVINNKATQSSGYEGAAEASGSMGYNILREYAGRKIPPGKGRPVAITLGDLYK